MEGPRSHDLTAMNRFENFTIELLKKARAASDYLPVRVDVLAQEFGIADRLIQEKLIELHKDQFIKLSAWDDSTNRERFFQEWPNAEFFFGSRWDGNNKRVRILLGGEELLEAKKDGASTSDAKISDMPGNIQIITDGIDQLRTELAEIRHTRVVDEGFQLEQLRTWRNRVYKQLMGWGLRAEAEEGFGNNSSIDLNRRAGTRAKMRDDRLKALYEDISSHPQHYEERLAGSLQPIKKEPSKPDKIFLGHGHNKVWARIHMYLKNELNLGVEVWESDPRTGHHTLDVLKGILDSCTFAVMVATGEDTTSDGGIRARQNVVHEIGLFQGRLGFEKVALLQQRGVEGFSNLAGLQAIFFHDDQVEATFYELDRMLKREGVK